MSLTGRFEQFVRSLLDEDDSTAGTHGTRFGGYALDPDYADAMSELEHFVAHGFDPPPNASPGAREARAGERGPRVTPGDGKPSPRPGDEPPAVRRAFRALEVDPGAPFDAVTRSYKRLMAEYHPDKHAGDTDRAEAATEVTKRLNLAYRAVRDYYLVIGVIDPEGHRRTQPR